MIDQTGIRIKKVAVDFGGISKLGELCGISRTQMSSYTSGTRVPNAQTLEKFANVGININWLLTGKGEAVQEINLDNESLELIEEFQNQVVALNNRLGNLLTGKNAGKELISRLSRREA